MVWSREGAVTVNSTVCPISGSVHQWAIQLGIVSWTALFWHLRPICTLSLAIEFLLSPLQVSMSCPPLMARKPSCLIVFVLVMWPVRDALHILPFLPISAPIIYISEYVSAPPYAQSAIVPTCLLIFRLTCPIWIKDSREVDTTDWQTVSHRYHFAGNAGESIVYKTFHGSLWCSRSLEYSKSTSRISVPRLIVNCLSSSSLHCRWIHFTTSPLKISDTPVSVQLYPIPPNPAHQITSKPLSTSAKLVHNVNKPHIPNIANIPYSPYTSTPLIKLR